MYQAINGWLRVAKWNADWTPKILVNFIHCIKKWISSGKPKWDFSIILVRSGATLAPVGLSPGGHLVLIQMDEYVLLPNT